jgi:hypothetical protein
MALPLIGTVEFEVFREGLRMAIIGVDSYGNLQGYEQYIDNAGKRIAPQFILSQQ